MYDSWTFRAHPLQCDDLSSLEAIEKYRSFNGHAGVANCQLNKSFTQWPGGRPAGRQARQAGRDGGRVGRRGRERGREDGEAAGRERDRKRAGRQGGREGGREGEGKRLTDRQGGYGAGWLAGSFHLEA